MSQMYSFQPTDDSYDRSASNTGSRSSWGNSLSNWPCRSVFCNLWVVCYTGAKMQANVRIGTLTAASGYPNHGEL